MTQPYLIAHKVRGEPAFDIAIQMPCPLCSDPPHLFCTECDDQHYWWIIPTSGHRAYPFWHQPLIVKYDEDNYHEPDWEDWGPMPDNIPDHYNVRAEAITKLTGLLDKLGLKKSRPPLTLRPL